MRLDFNSDGKVDMDDMRKNLNEFYDFLKNYDYIEASTRIKSNMYTQALQLMKKDQEDKDAAKPQAVEYADDDNEDSDE